MQTLRKRSSPCKYKNEPSRFLGEGMTFKAKLIGILQVNEARGDKMCQDALNDLKTAIRAAGEHKQRITISIAIDGLRLRDEKTGDCLYHHPVHKISFIAQDMSDSRAFGYIFGSPDTGHRFFGIKTDKTASQVVISMRDLFQVVFELKKKEIEMAKHHIEQRQIKYSTTVNTDSLYPLKDDYDADKGKGKYPQLIKIRSVTSKSSESTGASAKAGTSEAIADLLDLEHELNSIQQGINQMERITPSDPFGPLGRGDPFLDPFEDSFSSKVENISEVKVPPPVSTKTLSSKPKTPSQSCSVESPIEIEKQSKLFEGTNQPASKPNFFPQFSPVAKAEESHWFDQETESLFNDRTNVSNTEPTSSPITFPVQETFDPNQVPEEKKSPVKPDVFMELDPLGSGWVKPYVDKKDFFQDLKNPPKKVLKELLTDNYSNDNAHQLLGQLESSKSSQNTNTPNMEQSPKRGTFSKTPSTTLFQSPKEAGTNGSKYSKIDPFDDTDPFEKADPFSEKHFSSELPSLFTDKSFDGVFPEASTFDTATKEEDSPFSSSSIHGPLRVSLPPEKPDTNTPISLSSITSKFRNSPSPPESLRRKNYQVLKQSTDEKGDDNSRSPVQDEFFCSKVTSTYSPKTLGRKSFSSKSKFWNEEQEGSPNPSPKPALFSIKPPPLPPKKQPQFKPPARPPSLEEKSSHYDTLREEPSPFQEPRSPNKKSKRTGERSNFPVLPPPPQRKTQPEKNSEQKPAKEEAKEGSILNITLNQLDNTGLENLAVTLGIPSSHIYNMTLQELTKRLSVKYLKTEAKQSETFEADFESNFGKAETTNAPTYDKYAVFKELIENENKRVNGNINEKEESESNENSKQVEDRYAALRQLSVAPQKSENLSEDLDFSVEEDSSNRADNLSDNVRPKTADSLTPMNSVELATDSPIVVEKEDKEDEESVKPGKAEALKSAEVQNESPFAGKEQEDKRDNWATFDKLSLYELPAQPETFNDNDNSPFSSDGKEESFTWRKKTRQRMRNEVPWHDEDESWDDYSPKESYWSDESSHDDRSPDKRREGKYQRKTWSKQIRKMKGDQWCRRPKWNDDTEDEYEESWKNHRCRIGICDKDRKSEVCPINNWCNNKNELWVDSDRYMRCCRKKSESDEDYRRRCDSDTSDREYMWTFKRGFPEGYTPGEKQKPYYMLSRDYPERCHEPRSKHRKGESHKRPSSASESKRNYEQIGDHIVKGKRGLTEDDQSPPYHKDFRYCCPESLHHYNSYDRRQQVQCKKSARSRKNEVEQYGMESKEKKSDSFDYYKSTWHKDEGRRNRHYQFEDDFAPATPEKTLPRLESPKRDSSRSPRRRQRQVNSKDGYFRSDNNNESFDSFGAEFRSPETNKPQEEPEREREKERGQPSKQQIFGKNHFAVLTRQESSTSLRKSESINIFSRDNDPFEGDDFFSTAPPANHKLNKFTSEKSKSNSNVSDTFTWKEVFGESSFHD